METLKSLLNDAEAEDVDVHLHRSMIGSLMYLTNSRHDIIYLKGQPKLGLWYPRDSPFELEAYTNSDYTGASLHRKSRTGGCQFLSRLISWQCKKHTVVANSTTEVEYVATASCCRQVLWIQNQMLDYRYNFMNTKIFIDNESTICIVKNLVFHSKNKHIEIRYHFIIDSNEKKLIQMIKIHTDQNVADLLTKAFDVGRFQYLVYVLTVNPTIYTSCIKQFWATAKVKTVNEEEQIQALVDKKKDMFDTSILDDEEVVTEKEISAADPVITARKEVTTTCVELVKGSEKAAEGSEKVAKGSKKAAKGSSKRAEGKLEQKDAKRQSIEEENKFAELKRCLETIYDDDDVTIKATPLSFKSPTIVDYKIYIKGRKSFFKIIRANGNSQNYLTFGKMFKNFNKEDLEVLWSIVKARLKKTNPVDDTDNMLFQTLKIMFEHHVKDNIWKYQQGLAKVLNWKLFDSCRVYCVTTQNMVYCLLVEKMDGNVRDDNKRSRTERAFSTTTNPVRREYTSMAPKYTNCSFHHNPEMPCRTCTNCNRLGDFAKDCKTGPRMVTRVNAKDPTTTHEARGGAFMMGSEEDCHDSNIMTGTEPSSLGFIYEIEIADGQLVEINKVIRDCKLEIEGHTFDIDLIPLRHRSFNVVRIPLPHDKQLRVLGENPEEKMRHLMSAQAEEQKLKDIVVVRNFLE
nr:putative ribonuclease H-like domain-containing protein [Tanacetum cinerariifolium]